MENSKKAMIACYILGALILASSTLFIFGGRRAGGGIGWGPQWMVSKLMDTWDRQPYSICFFVLGLILLATGNTIAKHMK